MEITYVALILIGFTLAVIAGKILIPLLYRFNVGQTIREEGPSSHLKKSGTPTMGGIIFYISTIFALMASGHWDGRLGAIVVAMIGFGAVGFIDDFIKVVEHRNLGLTSFQKILLQLGISVMIVLYLRAYHNLGTEIIIPFSNRTVDLKFMYFPFVIFVMLATVNSTNLTDGLDGLCSGLSAICFAFFAILAIKISDKSVAYFSFAIIGSLLGFLFYNRYPAKIFMGDVGSLGLGGAISTMAILTKQPLILIIVCGVFVIETLSVIIQVFSYKIFKKRVFLMSPIHHHFELKGWKEKKVVLGFYAAGLLFSLISYLSIR